MTKQEVDNNESAELLLAYQEIAYLIEEKGKRASELVLANRELLFQNKEKEKRANELLLANSELDVLNTDVEEVREPTNSEKLMNKSKVSYPYYFNLNDFWSDSWFDRNNQDKGIKELEDGTFAANFDDLPESDDIKDSFNRLT